jgi:hypothetical protein
VSKDQYNGQNGVSAHNVVFQPQNIIMTRQMNTSNTNVGGYNSSAMKTFIEGAYKNALMAAGISHLTSVTRKLGTGNGGSAAADVTAQVFLPTEWEMFGAVSQGPSGENDGTNIRFPYYDSNAKRVKYDKNSAAAIYWLASPVASLTTGFCCVSTGGSVNINSAGSACGVAPCFLLS